MALVYTRYHSKCRISEGIKMTLGKGNSLSIIYIVWSSETINPTMAVLLRMFIAVFLVVCHFRI